MGLRLKLLKITFSHNFSPGFQKHRETFVTTVRSEDKFVYFCQFCLQPSLPCPTCVKIHMSTVERVVSTSPDLWHPVTSPWPCCRATLSLPQHLTKLCFGGKKQHLGPEVDAQRDEALEEQAREESDSGRWEERPGWIGGSWPWDLMNPSQSNLFYT